MYLRMEEARPGVTWTLKGRMAVAMASSVRVGPGLGARGMGLMLTTDVTVISEETSRHCTGTLEPGAPASLDGAAGVTGRPLRG